MKHAIRMTINRYLMMVTAILSVIIASCGTDHEPDLPVPPEPLDTSSHTILVYMVASNNLSGLDKSDIDEMLLLYDNPEVDMGNTKILVFQKSYNSSILSEVTSQGLVTLKEYSNAQLAVTVSRMKEVFSDMKALAPADEYGLVLWSHATGWLQNGVSDEGDKNIPVLRSYGSDNGNYMNITALASALEGEGFTYIYCDCCYMGGIEVLYQLRKCADYIIASPAEDPPYGMRYDLTLPALISKNLTLEERMIEGTKATADYYNSIFTKGDCPCTLTVIKTDKIDKLAEITLKIYTKAQSSINYDYTYQKYKTSGTCPYYDFDEYVESICESPDLLTQWRQALNDAVKYESHTPYIWHTPLNRCCGISSFILSSPLSISNNNSNTLAWYTDVASALIK